MSEWILTSSVLIAVVLLLRWVLRHRISLRLRYALWALVLVRLLVPVSITQSSLSISSLASSQLGSIESAVSTPLRSPAYESARREVLAQSGSLSGEELEEEVKALLVEQSYQQLRQEYMHAGETLSQIPDTQLRLGAQAMTEENLRQSSVSTVLLSIWLIGMIPVGLVFLWTNIRLAQHLQRSREKLDIGHPLPVYATNYVTTPCLFGLLRPAIYLPRGTEAGDALPHILAHETSHYRQGDHIFAMLRCVCLTLHWYNPLVWIAGSLSKKDAELSCDEATIARLGEAQRTAYGETLIAMTCAKRDPKDLFLTATTMNTGKRTLKERVTMIARHPKTAVYTLILLILVLSLAVGCTFTGSPEEPIVTTGPEETTVPPETTEAVPTGYPSGEVPIPMIYVNGNQYVPSNVAHTLTVPDGYDMVGSVLEQDNTVKPTEPLHSAHIAVGSTVFASVQDNSLVYICHAASNVIEEYVRADLSDHWILGNLAAEYVSLHHEYIRWPDADGTKHETVFMTLPDISPFSQDAIDAWQEIRQTYLPYLYEKQEALDNGIELGSPIISYTASCKNDILSILISKADTVSDFTEYQSYNFDVKTGERLDVNALMANLGYTADQYYTSLAACAEATFTLCWGAVEEDPDSFNYRQLQQTVSAENLAAAQPWLDENGSLHAAVNIYQLAGGEYSPTLISLNLSTLGKPAVFQPTGKQLEGSDAALIQALFAQPTTWYARAATSTFAAPAQIDLSMLFYSGIPGQDSALTAGEKDFLSNTWLGFYLDHFDFFRLPTEDMNKILEFYFGISLQDTERNGMENLVYWDNTDCYYMAHTDSNLIQIKVHSVYVQDDGTIHVYYCDGSLQDAATPDLVMTLQKRDDGNYRILSNLPVN